MKRHAQRTAELSGSRSERSRTSSKLPRARHEGVRSQQRSLSDVPLSRRRAATGASASGPRDRDDDGIEIVRVTAVTVQEADIELGEAGQSLGDQFIFSDDLFSRGEKVGIDGGICTLVRLVPMVSATLQCVATAELPKGQITAQASSPSSARRRENPRRTSSPSRVAPGSTRRLAES